MPNRSLYQQISNPIETYTDGYGQTREVYEPKYVGVLRKAYNLANRFLNGPSKEEYAQMGMRKPQYSLGPAEWIANPAKVISGTNKAVKAANAYEELIASGAKIDGALLKEMASGSISGQSGIWTKAAKEARKAYAEARSSKWGMNAKDAWNKAIGRFKYILENAPAGEIKASKPLSKPQSKLGDLDELTKLREKLGISIPEVTEKELKYWDIMERADLDDLAKPVTGPSKESLDFIKETFKNLSK